MAKKIFLSQEDIVSFINSASADLEAAALALANKRFQTDNEREIITKFNLNDFKDERTAEIKFTPTAWIKTRALVDEYKTEVQWHGVAERESESVFVVKDILVFPHEVTGTTVTSNQEEYEEWLDSLDDATFNRLRFHGHSHVNMAVVPSGTDMKYRKDILRGFGTPTKDTDLFYIFLITNKAGNVSAEVYDLQNNALYSTSEESLKVSVDLGGDNLTDFLDEAREVIKERSQAENKEFDAKKKTKAIKGGWSNYEDWLDDYYRR